MSVAQPPPLKHIRCNNNAVMVLTSDLRCADKKARTARITEPPLAEQDQAGCPEAITWEQIAGSSSAGHVSDDTVVPEEFIPGQHYVCGVDGCCFAVVLHEGSKKFWCALCHSRHKIVDNKIIRAKGPPISVTMPATQNSRPRQLRFKCAAKPTGGGINEPRVASSFLLCLAMNDGHSGDNPQTFSRPQGLGRVLFADPIRGHPPSWSRTFLQPKNTGPNPSFGPAVASVTAS
ncbi:hypothetical protein MRX96_035106 [Rhipicephalus microplus]